jgi:acyl carrier protein
MPIREKVDSFVREVLENDFSINLEDNKLTDETNLFEELDLDSIDAVDIVVRVQKQFEVTLSPEDFKEVRNYGGLLDVICKAVEAGA